MNPAFGEPATFTLRSVTAMSSLGAIVESAAAKTSALKLVVLHVEYSAATVFMLLTPPFTKLVGTVQVFTAWPALRETVSKPLPPPTFPPLCAYAPLLRSHASQQFPPLLPSE